MQFIDLKAQQSLIKKNVLKRINLVLEHGQYIMGPEIKELENNLSVFTNSKYVVSCSSGTVALWLVLLALNIKKNDAVFLPSFSFTSTAEVVALVGAHPIFIDVDDTYNICIQKLYEEIKKVKKKKLNPKLIIPVDLFGLPANYSQINKIAKDFNLKVLSDAAQSFGATYNNKIVGNLTDITATSFFPSKPLGCYGDGGAIFTNNKKLSEVLKSIRIHGRGNKGKYFNIRIGTNARLNTIQAAVLLEKLKLFKNELKIRQTIAQNYNSVLQERFVTPKINDKIYSAWAQYSIISKDRKREKIMENLKKNNIPTMIYYPKPIHQQKPYRKYFINNPTNLEKTEFFSKNIFSIPMHPYLKTSQQKKIIKCLL